MEEPKPEVPTSEPTPTVEPVATTQPAPAAEPAPVSVPVPAAGPAPTAEPTPVAEPVSQVVLPNYHPKRPLWRKPLFLALIAIIGVGSVAAVLALTVLKKTSTPASGNSSQSKAKAKSSVTLYYNDGKTVLWQTDTPAAYSATTEPKVAPYYVDTIRALLKKQYGENYYEKGEWTVTTSLDKSIQEASQQVIDGQKVNLTKVGANTLGFVAEDVTTGQVVAMVGNLNDNHSVKDVSPNYATSLQQPGTSITPLVYTAAIDGSTNLGAGSQLSDTKRALTGYPCTKLDAPVNSPNNDCLYDFDRRFPGPISLRYALGTSRLVPVVQVAQQVGIDKVQAAIKKLGVENGYNCYTDVALGKTATCGAAAMLGDGAYLPLDQEVHAYATLSHNGLKLPQTYLLKVAVDGNVKQEWKQPTGEQVILADAAYIIDDILSDPNASYLPASQKSIFMVNGSKLSLTPGTLPDATSATVIGYTTKYVAGFWLAASANADVALREPTETARHPLITSWMTAVQKGPIPERIKPASLRELPAYVNTAHVGFGSVEPSRPSDFYPGNYKP